MYEFRVIAPGLDAETIERAEAAAQVEFEKEYDIMYPNIPPRFGLTEREYDAAMAWMGAVHEAKRACYGEAVLNQRHEG